MFVCSLTPDDHVIHIWQMSKHFTKPLYCTISQDFVGLQLSNRSNNHICRLTRPDIECSYMVGETLNKYKEIDSINTGI